MVSTAAVTAAVVAAAATVVSAAVSAISAPAAEEDEDQDDPQTVISVVPAHSQEPPGQDGDLCWSRFILCATYGRCSVRSGLRVWPPQGNPGRPAKERDAPARGNAGRPATPAVPRMASGHDSPSKLERDPGQTGQDRAQNDPHPWSGTAGRQPAPALPEWTSRQQSRTAPAEAGTVPHTRYGGCTRKGGWRRLRRVLSPGIIIAEDTCKSNGFLLQS